MKTDDEFGDVHWLEATVRTAVGFGLGALIYMAPDAYTEFRNLDAANRSDSLAAVTQQVEQERDRLETQADSLQQLVDEQAAATRRYATINKMVETVPEHLDVEHYDDIIERYPRAEPLVEALVETGKAYYATGQDERNGFGIPPLPFSLAIMQQECSLRHGITDGRMTNDVDYIKRHLISSVGAAGCAQAMPHRARQAKALIGEDLNVYVTEEWERGWDLWQERGELRAEITRLDRIADAREQRRTDVETGDVHTYKILRLEIKEKLNRIDAIEQRMQVLFDAYEHDLASRVAGKSVEELQQIDYRLTPKGAARFLHNFGGKEMAENNGIVWFTANDYYSGNPWTRSFTKHYAESVEETTRLMADRTLDSFESQLTTIGGEQTYVSGAAGE